MTWRSCLSLIWVVDHQLNMVWRLCVCCVVWSSIASRWDFHNVLSWTFWWTADLSFFFVIHLILSSVMFGPTKWIDDVIKSKGSPSVVILPRSVLNNPGEVDSKHLVPGSATMFCIGLSGLPSSVGPTFMPWQLCIVFAHAGNKCDDFSWSTNSKLIQCDNFSHSVNSDFTQQLIILCDFFHREQILNAKWKNRVSVEQFLNSFNVTIFHTEWTLIACQTHSMWQFFTQCEFQLCVMTNCSVWFFFTENKF